jgi:hypothetical protein
MKLAVRPSGVGDKSRASFHELNDAFLLADFQFAELYSAMYNESSDPGIGSKVFPACSGLFRVLEIGSNGGIVLNFLTGATGGQVPGSRCE